MKKSKIIVVLIIITILALVGTVLGYLFVATDVFKTDKELFYKYISQNIEEFENITNSQTVDFYSNLKNENKYETNTTLKVIHSEGGEISHPLNNLSGKINIQKDKEKEYIYIDSQILYEDEKYLQAEIIKEKEIYGARIPEVIEQFLTIENNENMDTIATEIGIDAQVFQALINMLNFNDELISNEQKDVIKNKYSNIILSEIENGMFEKQKNEDSNSYSLLLRSEQVKSMLLKICNNVKEEKISNNEEIFDILDEIANAINEAEEIPSIKITVFENEQKTTKTVVEIGSHIITFECIEKNKEMQIIYSNSEQTEVYDLQIIKENIDNQENIKFVLSISGNEEGEQISFSNVMKNLDNGIELNAEISYKQDITTITLQIENNVTIGSEFETIQTIDSTNSRSINSLKPEKREEFFEMLKKVVPQTINERISLIEQKIWNEENEEQAGIPQVEINKFNSKFEFYTGDEVSSENVKKLLEVVKNHFSGYSSININPTESENINSKTSLTIYIEKDKVNEEEIIEILEKIDDNKKYKVLIKYKSENGLIDNIIITEI